MDLPTVLYIYILHIYANVHRYAKLNVTGLGCQLRAVWKMFGAATIGMLGCREQSGRSVLQMEDTLDCTIQLWLYVSRNHSGTYLSYTHQRALE